MKKITALFVASTLALGAANLAHAADTTATTQTDSKPMMHHKRPSLDERRAMHDLIASDTFDKAKASAQIDKMEAQHKEMMLSRMETQNKIYNILTPEQKKQFNANFEKHLTERKAPEGKMPAPAE